MLTKDVIAKYHAIVPFPWTPGKLKKGGVEPTAFILSMGRKLEQCTDKDTDEVKAILAILAQLKLFKT